jgi:hypothetical protein
MDIGHDTMGTIIINSYAFGVASVSLVTDIYSEDDAGAGASGSGNSRFTQTIGGVATHNNTLLNPLMVSAGDVITIGLNGAWTGVGTSIAWSVTPIMNMAGLVTSVSPTSGTSAGFDPVFSINSGAQPGNDALYLLTLEVTNSAGTTTRNWDLQLISP